MKSLNKLKQLILLVTAIVFFASCEHEKDPVEPFLKTDAYEETDILYATALDTGQHSTNLLMDLYFPAVDSVSQKFPAVLLIHAGSYLHGHRGWIEPTARILRDSGFITANIAYRLGWDVGDYISSDRNSLPEAEYRGMQDARAAMRYLVANAEKYRIDTSQLFILGESAGASIALNSAFATEETMLYKVPEMVYKLGRLDHSGNPYLNKYKIKGICSKYGSISDSLFINAFNSIPIICFHGSNDNLVPIYKGLFLGNPESPAFGSAYIYERQHQFGKICEFHLKTDGSHMPPEFNPNFCTPIVVDFFRGVIRNEKISSYSEH
ncbi:MAG: carboxylesterase type [Bacteroidetes bacterium]|jgi:predicted peptidase|nr:MAG: carboxylesterase type [Bacteroidota bacterium]